MASGEVVPIRLMFFPCGPQEVTSERFIKKKEYILMMKRGYIIVFFLVGLLLVFGVGQAITGQAFFRTSTVTYQGVLDMLSTKCVNIGSISGPDQPKRTCADICKTQRKTCIYAEYKIMENNEWESRKTGVGVCKDVGITSSGIWGSEGSESISCICCNP